MKHLLKSLLELELKIFLGVHTNLKAGRHQAQTKPNCVVAMRLVLSGTKSCMWKRQMDGSQLKWESTFCICVRTCLSATGLWWIFSCATYSMGFHRLFVVKEVFLAKVAKANTKHWTLYQKTVMQHICKFHRMQSYWQHTRRAHSKGPKNLYSLLVHKAPMKMNGHIKVAHVILWHLPLEWPWQPFKTYTEYTSKNVNLVPK